MRIAVTGKTGQIVSSLLERGALSGHEVVAFGRPELDLSEPAFILRTLQAVQPDIIVSAAAYTAVDRAESEIELAYAVNARGAGSVAEAARTLRVPLVHISTDYVFDGKLGRAYRETDATHPNGVYGASKLAGEEEVRSIYGENSAILRVAWVYSPFGSNFVKTMLRLATERDEVSVVADQHGNPTCALDIADGILNVASNLISECDPSLRGVFHMTAAGDTHWAGFAEAVFSASEVHGGPVARVKHVTTEEYPTAATRPANSRLACDLIARAHGIALPHWRGSLETVVARLQGAST